MFELPVKKKDEMNKLKTIGAMCIALFVIFVILIPTAVSYQDLEYMEWRTEKIVLDTFYDKQILEASKDGDWVTVKIYANLQFDLCSEVLDKITQFDLSPGYLRKARYEADCAYNDKRWSAFYLEKAADAWLTDDAASAIHYWEECHKYLEKSIEHRIESMEYRAKYIDELEDAETPGFGAILAIICVLAVGHFVIRRRMR